MDRYNKIIGKFLSLEDIEACRNPRLQVSDAGERGVDYVAVIDGGANRQFSVGCICHRDGDITVIDRIDSRQPTQSNITRAEWIEEWVSKAADKFGRIRFVVDDYDHWRFYLRLDRRYVIERCRFSDPYGSSRLMEMLYVAVSNQQVQWYAGCGDLETELASLVVAQNVSGMTRINRDYSRVDRGSMARCLSVAISQTSVGMLDSNIDVIRHI